MIIALAALTAGCAGSNTDDAEAEVPDGTFASVDDLVAAVADAGWECDVPLETPVRGNTEGIRYCSPVEDEEALAFEVFADDGDVDAGADEVEAAAETNVEYGYAVNSYIVGANWIVDGPIEVLDRIHDDLGGELVDLTPPEATPEQLASVIAASEDDWRATIDGAYDCRYLWVFEADSQDVADQLNAQACYWDELTIGVTTQQAADELAGMTPPASMEDLVEDTIAALEAVAATDLEAICGDAIEGRTDSPACSDAIGTRMWSYQELEEALDAWRPYL